MLDLQQIIETFITQENLEETTVLVLVSGGVDSVVLLDQLVKSQMVNVEVFHLNHKTRPESDNDADFVAKVCKQYDVVCHIETLKQSSESNKEASWRKERLTRAQQIAKTIGAARILTAHHATDLVETMIHRMSKGCGLDGMSPFDTTTKPFWMIPKEDIVTYAQNNNLSWVEDSSNQDQTFERNLIRQSVLPQLRKITPNIEKVFVKEAKLFSQAHDYTQQQAKEYLTQKSHISLFEWASLHPFFQQLILKQIGGKATSFNEIQDTRKWLNGNPEGNTKKQLGSTQLIIHKNEIVVLPPQSPS